MTLASLQQQIQHVFTNKALLQQALTHRSFSSDHNERLEFLGDSVLGMAVAALLFRKLSHLPEGSLSRVRANLVCQDSLHQLALALHLPKLLRIGEGESKTGGHQRPSMLADALEALIGAVYLDAGFEVAQQLVWRFFADMDFNPQMQEVGKDAKTQLQELLQGRQMKLPDYIVLQTIGAAHAQTFEVECRISVWKLAFKGKGNSRRAGEQSAAALMLAHITKEQLNKNNVKKTAQILVKKTTTASNVKPTQSNVKSKTAPTPLKNTNAIQTRHKLTLSNLKQK